MDGVLLVPASLQNIFPPVIVGNLDENEAFV